MTNPTSNTTDTVEQRARELLAKEYAKCGMEQHAYDIRTGQVGTATQLALNAVAAALRSVEQPSAQAAWRDASTPPILAIQGSAYFFVAVRRSSGKVYTFPARYCHRVRLLSEDREDSYGPGWSQVAMPESIQDWDIEVTGWYSVETDESGEYDERYVPVCNKDDEVVAWHPAPTYTGPTAPREAAQEHSTPPDKVSKIIAADEAAWSLITLAQQSGAVADEGEDGKFWTLTVDVFRAMHEKLSAPHASEAALRPVTDGDVEIALTAF